MDSLDSVLDPSDWLTTKLPPLYQLDSMIRCHICKEFMTSPVLTGCGHCFCSLCIRSTLASIGKCPLCNEEQIESKLRKNLILEEIIVFFKKYRGDLKDMLTIRSDEPVEFETRELITLDSDDEGNNTKRSSSPMDTSIGLIRKRQRSTPMSVTERITQQSQTKQQLESLSECPICHNFFPLNEIETTHIDECLNNKEEAEKKPKKTTLSNFFIKKQTPEKKYTFDKNKQYQIQNGNINKPLKKLNFTSLNTTKLKEKLSLLSIPTSGTRQQLETRYNQYVILYNSNLDSVNPVPLKQLRANLNQWEFLNNNMDSNLQLATKQKDVDRENWVGTYNDEFKKLIQKAKEGSKKIEKDDSASLTDIDSST